MRAAVCLIVLSLAVPPAVVLSVGLVRSLGLSSPPPAPLPVWRWRCAR